MKRSTLVARTAVALLAAWSCNAARNPAAPGTTPVATDVRLMDAPSTAALGSVNVYIDHVDASVTTDTTGGPGAQPWITLVAPHHRYDLLTLQGGTTALLGTTQLSPSQYREIRVVLNTDSSALVRTDGTPAPVSWGSAGQISVHVLVETPVQISGPTAHILLDFTVANSFVPDPRDPSAFLFLPWIRALSS
jgi:hypothetical protein